MLRWEAAVVMEAAVVSIANETGLRRQTICRVKDGPTSAVYPVTAMRSGNAWVSE